MDSKRFSEIIDRVDAELDADHLEGYQDGYDTDAIAPNDNRSEAYRHSWNIGRADREKRDIPPAWQSRMEVQAIRSRAITEALTHAPRD